jgi:hypothetical protein
MSETARERTHPAPMERVRPSVSTDGGTGLGMTRTVPAGLRATVGRHLLDHGWRLLLRRDPARAVAASAVDGTLKAGR